MTNKKKIALLNFPLDNNFGGNLQRYALIKVLTDMGYEVEHLSTQFTFIDYRPLVKRIKTWIKFMLGRLTPISYPMPVKRWMEYKSLRPLLPFYDKYIPHTKPIYSYEDLKDYQDYDIYLVGSDQVWRRSMSGVYPYTSMFFDFVNNPKAKKVAYGVSMGTANNELSDDELTEISPLYAQFSATSVREASALDLFEQYGWVKPQAEVVLDPTLLLNRQIYEDIISNAKTIRHKEEVYCYVLDVDAEKKSKIDAKLVELGAKAHYCVLGEDRISIEQWLRNVRDARYVITDSYHGVLFSIIFNKPFLFLYNERRGNERVQFFLQCLGIKMNAPRFDWDIINERLEKLKLQSISILEKSLKCNK